MSPLVQKFNGVLQLALKILGGFDWLLEGVAAQGSRTELSSPARTAEFSCCQPLVPSPS